MRPAWLSEGGDNNVLTGVQRLLPSDEVPPGGRAMGPPFGSAPSEHEDLPYRVELWNDGKTGVEVVLAVTASASIGFAAYFAATREYPNRYVALRHKGSFISRWNGPTH